MGYKVVSNDGNGHIVGKSVFSYSYSEQVTPLEPSDNQGGTGQVTFSARAISGTDPGTNHHNSKLMINNSVSFTDDEQGTVGFVVKKVAVADDIVSVTGDTIQARLNVSKDAAPHGGTGANLLTAILYYCSLVQILPIIDATLRAKLAAIPVNYIGWTGNVWDHLKMLCSTVSTEDDNFVGLEMYIDNADLHFREALTTVHNFTKSSTSESVSVDTFDSAKSIDVYNYNTSYGVDKVIYEESNYAENVDPTKKFKSSIDDPMQVEAGETVTKIFKIDATLYTVNQPVCVATINNIVYPNPYTGKTGEYVVVGTDNLPIQPSQWVALGGSLSISLTGVPGEIQVTITAPPVSEIEKAAGGTGLAPYKIGVESSGDTEYPAFWITGTGVFFNKQKETFLTGASSATTSKDSATTIDNPFVTSKAVSSSRGVAAAQVACGPKVSISRTVSQTLGYGETLGTTEYVHKNRFRTVSANYSAGDTSLSQIAVATIQDFNNVWADKTFDDFIDFTLDPGTSPSETLKFNEFTVIPLGSAN
jgi:hypothetical protein